MINIRNVFVTCFMVAVVVGCSTSPTTRLYVLNTDVESPARSVESISSVVVVDLVLVPDYLDQNKIVTRVDQYRLERLEFDRWAEPLDFAISDAIASTLRSSTPGARIVSYPWTESGSDVQKLNVRLQRFEPTAGGQVVIEGTYVLRRLGVEPSYVPFKFIEQMQSGDPADAVAAMSAAVESLGLQIAQDLNQNALK